MAALFAVVGIVMAASFWTWSALAQAATQELKIEKAGGGSVAFSVEVADTEAEKAKGLMFRTKLADNQGMLFPYGKPRELTMWMHNTYIPLDMVFIKADGVIHRIEAHAEPLSDRVISSDGDVSAVLEIAGGAAERLSIKTGDRVLHKAFKSAR